MGAPRECQATPLCQGPRAAGRKQDFTRGEKLDQHSALVWGRELPQDPSRCITALFLHNLTPYNALSWSPFHWVHRHYRLFTNVTVRKLGLRWLWGRAVAELGWEPRSPVGPGSFLRNHIATPHGSCIIKSRGKGPLACSPPAVSLCLAPRAGTSPTCARSLRSPNPSSLPLWPGQLWAQALLGLGGFSRTLEKS